MSCNFNISKCKTCPRYNGCLLQVIYSNIMNLGNMISDLYSKQNAFENKLNEIINSPINSFSDKTSYQIEELSQNLNNLKNNLSILDVKVDNVINANKNYEFIEEENDEGND